MALLPSASDSEPILILTDQDYQRALASGKPPAAPAPPAPAAVPPEAPARPAGRGHRHGLTALLCVLLLAGGGAAFYVLRSDPARPAPPAPVVARAPAPKPAPPPKHIETPPPAPPPLPPLEPAAEPEEETKPAIVAPSPVNRALWNGGRAWVQVQLRMEHQSQVQEMQRRAAIVWDGAKYAVERPASGTAEIWMERLELLLNLPQEDDSWQRHPTRTGAETLHVQSGDLACRLVEGEDRFPQGVRSFRYWYSDEFPAGAIQAELTFRDLKLSCRVLAFGPSSGSEQKP